MIDWGEVFAAVVVGGVVIGVPVAVVRGRAQPVPEPPNPLADSPAVAATLAALGPQLAAGQPGGWLVLAFGTDRRAVEALVSSLQPGLPADGPFDVNRLVGSAPVRLSGQVADGVPVVTSAVRLDVPGQP